MALISDELFFEELTRLSIQRWRTTNRLLRKLFNVVSYESR